MFDATEILEPVMTHASKALWPTIWPTNFAENLKPDLTHAAEIPWPVTIHVIYDGFSLVSN